MAANLTTTAKLMKMLESSPRRFYERYVMPRRKEQTFHEYLLSLMKDRDMNIPQLIVGTQISKSYAYQVLNGERLPGRDIIIRMAIAMSLDPAAASRLLTLAGKNPLYPKLRRDAGILLCLKKKYTLAQTNEFLERIGESSLQ